MKICWDNLEKLTFNKKTGKWYQIRTAFVYEDACSICDEPYLRISNRKSYTCGKSCANKGKNNPMYGKKLEGEKNGFYGKKHSKKTIEKNRKAHIKENGVCKNNIPFYDTYAPQIEYAEKVRRNKEDEDILEVKCAYCGKWYIPKRTDVFHRVDSLNGKRTGEQRLYCSDECKNECPIYYKSKYSAEETSTKQYSREVQPELRQMVFERDNYTCQKCGSNKSLHCHHIEGIRHDPLESADIDKCITYCKKCHKQVHKKKGCKYIDMQCKER